MKAKHKNGYGNNSEANSSIRLLKGRYEIISYLGSGGFGTTFLALDTDLPSRQKCVVKVLSINKPESAQFIERSFNKEAQTLERLSKDCDGRIPELYAYFVQNGNYYLVQEYVEGLTLTNLLQVKQLEEKEVVVILIELLRTLRYLHKNQVVHRDIKPDNIIIRNTDSIPVLIDFGAVKQFLTVDADVTKNVTVVVGTPGFMPLEQLMGNPTYASDIYALGMTAIYMLSGTVFQQNTQDWHKNLEISNWLVEVIDKAIAPALNDRFQSAQDMLDALRNQSAQEPKTRQLIVPISRYPKLTFDTDKLVAGMVFLATLLPIMFFINAFGQVDVLSDRSISNHMEIKFLKQVMY